jgi:hypothetical protein
MMTILVLEPDAIVALGMAWHDPVKTRAASSANILYTTCLPVQSTYVHPALHWVRCCCSGKQHRAHQKTEPTPWRVYNSTALYYAVTMHSIQCSVLLMPTWQAMNISSTVLYYVLSTVHCAVCF